MRRLYLTAVSFLFALQSFAQNAELPADFRQHNLGQLNSSLFQPTFALDRNRPRSIALWSRWQWQGVDGDPTTLFLNYTQRINQNLAGGIGFLQHNTGIYLQSGAQLNIAWAIALNESTSIHLGANIFSFNQKLADGQLVLLSEEESQDVSTGNIFSTQISPGIRLMSNSFGIGFTLQNAFSLKWSGSDTVEESNVFSGFLSNDFPITFLGSPTIIRPQAYLSAISGFDTQVGLLTMLEHPNFWAQGGYNSYYGPSFGLGVTLAKTIVIGGLLEFVSSDQLSDQGTTFELSLAYLVGKQRFEKPVIKEEDVLPIEIPEPEEEGVEELKRAVDSTVQKKDGITAKTKEAPKKPTTSKPRIQTQSETPSKRELRRLEKRRQDSIVQAEKAATIAKMEKRRLDSINAVREVQAKIRREQDSIEKARAKALELAKEKARLDSIAASELSKDVVLQDNERYEEVTKEEGLEPGFYLIANVFGTKKYYENFMKTLKAQGLSPGSFYRSANKYNYVYLKRYNSINAARAARDSRFDGKYTDKLWILRIR